MLFKLHAWMHHSLTVRFVQQVCCDFCHMLHAWMHHSLTVRLVQQVCCDSRQFYDSQTHVYCCLQAMNTVLRF
jgi:hypothetical protein